MGRQIKQNYSVYNILLDDKKKIKKYHKKIQSLTSLSEIVHIKQIKIKDNFMIFMRRLLAKNYSKNAKFQGNWKKNKINKKNNDIIESDKVKSKQSNSKQNEYLISFLNIMKSCSPNNNINNNNQDNSINLISMLSNFNQKNPITYNPKGITSIQNMISQHFINIANHNTNFHNNNNNNNNNNIMNSLQQNYYHSPSHKSDYHSYTQIPTNSTLFLCQPYLQQLIISQPQFPVHFVCLYEKISQIINIQQFTQYQNRQIIKGTWNILIKYWKDKNYIVFSDVGQNIQWGLLNLLEWQFNLKRKQLFQREEQLRYQNCCYQDDGKRMGNLSGQSERDIQFDSDEGDAQTDRRYFCTLEHIQ